MYQLLPDIVSVHPIPCSSLPPYITEMFRAHMQIPIFPLPPAIMLCGNSSCEAEQEYDNGGYIEKTVLQFSTTEDISQYPPLAFVIIDAPGQSFLIGTHEAPYPIVEITKSIDKDKHVNTVKVTFTKKKSLVPCMI